MEATSPVLSRHLHSKEKELICSVNKFFFFFLEEANAGYYLTPQELLPKQQKSPTCLDFYLDGDVEKVVSKE